MHQCKTGTAPRCLPSVRVVLLGLDRARNRFSTGQTNAPCHGAAQLPVLRRRLRLHLRTAAMQPMQFPVGTNSAASHQLPVVRFYALHQRGSHGVRMSHFDGFVAPTLFKEITCIAGGMASANMNEELKTDELTDSTRGRQLCGFERTTVGRHRSAYVLC
jgi:hypothetical protein